MGAMGDMMRSFRSLSRSPRELWMVFVLQFIESLAYFSMSMDLTLFLSEDFEMTDVEAGLVYGMFGGLTTGFGFLTGFLIDNLGVKLSLITGYMFLIAARFTLAFTTDKAFVYVALYGLMPFGSALAMPVFSMGIKRYTTENNRGFAFGLFYSIMNIAGMFAGFEVDAFDLGEKKGKDVFGMHLSSKRLILLAGGCLSVLALILCLFIREIKVDDDTAVDSDEEDRELKEFRVKRVSPFQIIKELCTTKLFWKFIVITLICVQLKMLFRYNDSLLGKFLVREFGDNVPKGAIQAINPACIMILVPIVAAMTSKVRPYRMILFGSYITALCPLPLCFATSMTATVWYTVILSVGEAFWSPRFIDLTVSMAPEGREGTFLALGSAPLFLAKLPVGPLSGWLLETFCPAVGARSSKTMWWIIFLMTAPAPIMLTIFKKCLGNVKASDIGDAKLKIQTVDLDDSSDAGEVVRRVTDNEDSEDEE